MSFAFRSKLKEEPLDEKEYWKNRCKDLEQELEYVKFKYSQSSKSIDKLMGVEELKWNKDLQKWEFKESETK